MKIVISRKSRGESIDILLIKSRVEQLFADAGIEGEVKVSLKRHELGNRIDLKVIDPFLSERLSTRRVQKHLMKAVNAGFKTPQNRAIFHFNFERPAPHVEPRPMPKPSGRRPTPATMAQSGSEFDSVLEASHDSERDQAPRRVFRPLAPKRYSNYDN